MNDVDVDQLSKAIYDIGIEHLRMSPTACRDLAEFLLARYIITERANQCPATTNTGRHCEVRHPHKRHETTLSNGGTFAWTGSGHGRPVT